MTVKIIYLKMMIKNNSLQSMVKDMALLYVKSLSLVSKKYVKFIKIIFGILIKI